MRRKQPIPHPGGRPTCYGCFRPQTHCVCTLISPFTAHCNILILQHPNERFKYYGTAKLVLRALTNAALLRGVEFQAAELQNALVGQRPYLLFPSKEAHDCESVPLDATNTVIVVDGTWDEAKKILFRNPILKTVPHLTFNKPLRSNYRIRKQPRDHYLSTIESIGHLLKLNAEVSGVKSTEYDALFTGFQRMVERQLKYVVEANCLRGTGSQAVDIL